MDDQITAGRFSLALLHPFEVALDKLEGIGPKTVKRLQDRGLMDQLDLLLFTPRKYKKIHHFFTGPQLVARRAGHVELVAPIIDFRVPQGTSKAPIEVILDAEEQQFRVLWFGMNKGGFARMFGLNKWMLLSGDVDYERDMPTLSHPSFEIHERKPDGCRPYISIEPVYPSMEGVAERTLRRGQLQALNRLGPALREVVPRHLRDQHDLPGVKEALEIIHMVRPFHDLDQFMAALARARKRLVYEEFYTLQHKLAKDVEAARATGQAMVCETRDLGRKFLRDLPFALTGDQKRAVATIARELERPVPMRRMVQGDVGSGKTVVALTAAALAIGNGAQVAMMAPTDILARQHLERADSFFRGLGLRRAFLGGSMTAAEKRETLALLAAGQIDLIVGTHALFQNDVVFKNLRLALIDEQHKFGVEQREVLLSKGVDTHLLSMTATPIPRSLAHAVFGDLDLTIIREKPPGRQPIRTVLRDRTRAPRIYSYVRQRVQETGEQAYFVFPMIEQSGAVPDRRSVTEAFEELSSGPLAGLSVGLLHGKLSGDEKADVMRRFSAGELQVLCSTTVIEVGVDVPNATMMIIESPEVFGLSQLHQLRGRVGRGSTASMCVLIAGEHLQQPAVERLSAFTQTDDGFKLAEADLQQRGPGLFLGTRQAGHAEFRFADIFRDAALLATARADARALVLGEEDEDAGDEL